MSEYKSFLSVGDSVVASAKAAVKMTSGSGSLASVDESVS